MYKVNTPDGEKYMVQLVGPASYRLKGTMAVRGQTLTVSKRTRDYLVRKCNGAWDDYDPTPAEPIDAIRPPQFGDNLGPVVDSGDFDMDSNPPLSMEQAAQLAGHIPVADQGPAFDPADLDAAPQPAPAEQKTKAAADERGDMSSADLKPSQKNSSGGRKKASSGNVKVEEGGPEASATTIE